MKRICVLIVVGVFAAFSLSYGQGNVRKQLAEELLLLTEVDKTIGKTFEMVREMQMTQVKGMELPTELPQETRERMASMQGEIMDFIAEEFKWDKIKEDFIGVYADVFTKEELEGIIAFYKTPVGQKFIKKQPELMQKSMQISQKHITNSAFRSNRHPVSELFRHLSERSDACCFLSTKGAAFSQLFNVTTGIVPGGARGEGFSCCFIFPS